MEIKPETFKASLPIQIRFGDIDALGHINNNIYFSYFDLGKTTYFDNIRPASVSWTEGLIVVAHIEVDFFSPIYYKEKIAVDTKVIKLGDKSGVFLQQIRNVKNGEIKCRCQSVFVTYNAQTQSSMPIPDDWRKVISEYEEVEL
ncbi:acyl-CoA thioester hydrolase [Dysgonomonas sp. PFB1-18]|uniref:acyl-CoA thioesterase n=1 Tax=unclassified Dysgonomonas TaxID=2630389 RepID=UPI002474D3BE|nr:MULTISPECIES: thioesterase family protein [unclassified Dysgonomonas]MDH6309827.1 acyl-CoA thioester hydrolase [Dysgonomonas sp. PF1-14]MDH6339371.1 acyl-CoA thioester hydrolase [Dysgonomonas sp. PF1-16]MDH6380870.1 acyl-CoA thioester hydrolase [Dysgonomonas sp. PFB1-18]MDH6397879.1 acyl-CoA thioester hydrolase [Dysgonomonas sp. PF1-23]